MMRRVITMPVAQSLLLLLVMHCKYAVSFADTESCNLNTPTLPLQPKKLTTPAGYPLYYLLPSAPPRGVLVYLHGCYHAGYDFFLMPEERIIAQQALCSNLAVLSLESSDRNWGCWRTNDDAALFWDNGEEYGDGGDDDYYQYTNDVVTKWMEYVDLPNELPRYGLGVSTGASILLSGFASQQVLKLDAVASYIIYPGQIDNENIEGDLPQPTVFVHMPRDSNTAKHVARYVKTMNSNDIDAEEYMVHPKPFDVARCAFKIPELGREKCTKLITHFAQNHPNLLDPNTFEVKVGHEDEGWLKAWNEIETELVGANGAIESYKGVYYTSKTGKGEDDGSDGQLAVVRELTFKTTPWIWACVLEEIGVCYARHKVSVEYLDEVLQFFMKHSDTVIDCEENTLEGTEEL